VSLCTSAAVCRRFRDMHAENSDLLWSALLLADFPLLRSDLPPKQAYAICPGLQFEAQIVNGPNLTRGNFGSVMWASVSYRGPNELEAHSTSPGLLYTYVRPIAVPSMRTRPCTGGKEFEVTLESFTLSLRVGMVIELQWKAREAAPRFLWWFALVHKVISPEEVVVFFPQYGPRPENDASALTAVATLNRTRMTSMHGGVAGGVRVPEAACVVQWWLALGTADLDLPNLDLPTFAGLGPQLFGCRGSEGVDVPDVAVAEFLMPAIVTLRTEFLRHLPDEQPALSLQYAGVGCDEMRRTCERIRPTVISASAGTDTRKRKL